MGRVRSNEIVVGILRRAQRERIKRDREIERAREREKERKRERKKERKKERKRERARESLCPIGLLERREALVLTFYAVFKIC